MKKIIDKKIEILEIIENHQNFSLLIWGKKMSLSWKHLLWAIFITSENQIV